MLTTGGGKRVGGVHVGDDMLLVRAESEEWVVMRMQVVALA